MSATPRRLAPLFLLTAVVTACVSSVSPAPSSRSSTPPSTPVASSTVPATPRATPRATLPSTTTTEFGTIWDDLPSDFPKLPGQKPTEPTAPASAAFVVDGQAKTLAASLGTLLTQAGWTVDIGSPLEDGSVVLEAQGQPDGCRTEARFTPLSGTVTVTVLYGAACPFS
ncbi:MAG TPA: hypothetical protein VFJ71_07760 [Candidatus Limnocylindrales bacterium]|nr:hypothetical protein [Candidatus Limnocylindrales bacterium]